MNKAAILSLLLLITNISHAFGSEKWECALDLQQGDKGSMSLQRSDASISGSINIDRNGNEFTQELEGSWAEQKIELKRFVNSNSNQTMHGIAIRVGAKQVKMGGRHAEGLNGVWSADCDLVSSTGAKAKSTGKDPSKIEPSISVRTVPSKPNKGDKIEFSARAFHPEGIESIEFFVNDKSIHQCENEECSIKHGPLKPGKNQWHVIAKSKSGVENAQRSIDLFIGNRTRPGICTIQGIATGPAVAQSQKVSIQLNRKSGAQNKGQSKRFDAGTYRFDNLGVGNYELSIDTPDDLGIIVSPAKVQITCSAGGSMRQNFEFR